MPWCRRAGQFADGYLYIPTFLAFVDIREAFCQTSTLPSLMSQAWLHFGPVLSLICTDSVLDPVTLQVSQNDKGHLLRRFYS
ncbi:hypothetical protein CTA2_5004 [Colletotrichum tanaceti]|uniref:Uncharacterized protein n=1 Tax=Colletotrichum tanaceti TaxID=1306861 RepID=A0A4U6XQV0_9PEZI|nr:hypothetical protein CTA2_5004 [Colletotrichum tanaceti]TKW58194.1 hypothetical protein CTA1_7584 [Colletotrichum tanaceti]